MSNFKENAIIVSRKVYIKYLDELGLEMDDDAFIMCKKYHTREIGYGVLLHRYKREKFEIMYEEWLRNRNM